VYVFGIRNTEKIQFLIFYLRRCNLNLFFEEIRNCSQADLEHGTETVMEWLSVTLRCVGYFCNIFSPMRQHEVL
jgi:hypothetical protein